MPATSSIYNKLFEKIDTFYFFENVHVKLKVIFAITVLTEAKSPCSDYLSATLAFE